MINRIANTRNSTLVIRPLAAAVALCLKHAVSSRVPATGLALLLVGSGLAHAETYLVTNTNDAGAGSLRQAIVDANANTGADEILFDTAVSGTLNLSSGALELFESVTISGPGPEVLAIDAGDASDIFVVSDASSASAIELNVSGVTLANATRAISAELGFIDIDVTLDNATISGCVESAIRVFSYFATSNVVVSNSVLSTNDGDAISLEGSPYGRNGAVLENVTIASNGGVGVDASGAGVRITESEITSNSIGLLGGSDWNYLGSGFDVEGSIIADNDAQGFILGQADRLDLENSSVSGNGAEGILASNLFISATLQSSTISGNGKGGVAFGIGSSDLTITNSTISGNRNGFGLSVESDGGETTVTNSTITGNAAGGIDLNSNNQLGIEVANSIVAGNGTGVAADLFGDGVFAIQHTLVQDAGDVDIAETIPGSNVLGVKPLLGPLQDNGGATRTHALLSASPAIDQGDNATCVASDQRGVARPQDGDGDGAAICDMGAYERSLGSGVIGDLVWRDDDGDGVRDPGEPGVEGVTVNLRVGCNPATLLSTITDSNGAYRFDDLAIGRYQLEFVKPAGYLFSPAIAAGDYNRDSNADPVSGLDQCRTLSKRQSRLALDAGLIPDPARGGSGVIGDLVWRDDDGDGVQDPGEPGLPGVTVKLRVGCDPSTLLSTTTDSNGAYRFEGLPEGDYQLAFEKPAGYFFSPLIAAGDYNRDSNADPQTGSDQCRLLNEGQSRLALDAGLIPE